MPGISSHDASMPRNLDTVLLRTFVTVARTASMTAAADVLHLTQGAVSQQVRRLEEAFGCLLFERDRRGLRLTASGERLSGRATRLLGLHDEIWAEMSTGAVVDQVRLGVPYDLVGARLAPALKTYAEAFPRVEVTLACAASPELTQALAAGRIDLAVVEEAAGPSAGECLSIEHLVWIGARAGTAHLKRPLPVSLVAATCAFRPAVLAALEAHGVAWRPVFENGNLEATAATVHADLAVTAWVASIVPDRLDVLPVGAGLPDLPGIAVNLHLPGEDARPAVTGLAAHVREAFARGGREA